MRGCTSPDSPRRTDPSSGPAGHLLPQGEKEGRLRVEDAVQSGAGGLHLGGQAIP